MPPTSVASARSIEISAISTYYQSTLTCRFRQNWVRFAKSVLARGSGISSKPDKRFLRSDGDRPSRLQGGGPGTEDRSRREFTKQIVSCRFSEPRDIEPRLCRACSAAGWRRKVNCHGNCCIMVSKNCFLESGRKRSTCSTGMLFSKRATPVGDKNLRSWINSQIEKVRSIGPDCT